MSTGLLPKCPQQPGVGQVEARNQESDQVSTMDDSDSRNSPASFQGAHWQEAGTRNGTGT